MALRAPADRGPTPFGPYLLDALLAEGGMARVYRARLRGALGFEKPLVVKQVRPELARDPRFVAMFAKEAKALVRLVHPHIVPVYELGVVDGVYFIAMEHIAGATLEGVLAAGPLDPGEACQLGVQVAEALQHAHERHALVHRDVTPRNVMVDEGGHARLLDFGIATPAAGSEGAVFGTPGYLSPEQARGEDVSPASDIFSLGCVLVRAMTGVGPFDGDGGRQRLLAKGRPDLTALPAPLADLLTSMLADEATERPAARLTVRRLRGWLAGAHPEGVAATLADRVLAAAQNAPAVQTPAQSTAAVGKVDALATSQLLAEARPGGATVGPESPDATAPIAGRRAPMDRSPEGEGTQAIDGRKGRSAQNAHPEAAAPAATGKASPSRWTLALVGVAGVALVAGLGITTAPSAAPPSAEPPGTAASEPLQPPPPAAEARAPATGAYPGPEPLAEGMPEAEALVPLVPSAPSEPEAAAAASEDPAARGILRVTASPWATVFVDGRALGTTPIRGSRLGVGTHRVRLECPPLGVTLERDVEVESGASIALFGALDEEPARMTVR